MTFLCTYNKLDQFYYVIYIKCILRFSMKFKESTVRRNYSFVAHDWHLVDRYKNVANQGNTGNTGSNGLDVPVLIFIQMDVFYRS